MSRRRIAVTIGSLLVASVLIGSGLLVASWLRPVHEIVTGSAGPAGPAGTAGPTGPTGSTGSAGSAASKQQSCPAPVDAATDVGAALLPSAVPAGAGEAGADSDTPQDGLGDLSPPEPSVPTPLETC